MNRLLSAIVVAGIGVALWGMASQGRAQESTMMRDDVAGDADEPHPAVRRVVYPGTSWEGAESRLREIREQRAREFQEQSGSREWLTAVAVDYMSSIYASPARTNPVSQVRAGSLVRVSEPVKGSGCREGDWRMLSGGGYICSGSEFELVRAADDTVHDVRPPLDDQPMPYEYLKVSDPTAHSFRSPPSSDVLRAFRESGKRPREAHGQLDGTVFYALDKEVRHDGTDFYRLINGRYVEKAAVERVTPTELHGHWPEDASELPMAFVHREEAPVYEEADPGELRRIGIAKKYARFSLDGESRIVGDEEFFVTRSGHLVHEDDVRVVDVVAPPPGVPRNEKWISVSVSQQTLTAYEGEMPVFVTLVSTGLSGSPTPLGRYRINNKRVSTTMRGTDARGTWYYIAEVPWAMYYRRLYAIHGAYWHDVFGNRRSSGCTNMSPLDAFWLFHWVDPPMRDGWHTVRLGGTHVHFAP